MIARHLLEGLILKHDAKRFEGQRARRGRNNTEAAASASGWHKPRRRRGAWGGITTTATPSASAGCDRSNNGNSNG